METRKPEDAGHGMQIWKPVEDALSALNGATVSASRLFDPLGRDRAGQTVAATEAIRKELRAFVPRVRLKIVTDRTGSMSDDQSVVQTDVAPFIVRSMTSAFDAMPDQVKKAIHRNRKIEFIRMDFGDGSTSSGGWGEEGADGRIDSPYLKVNEGEIILDTDDLQTGWRKIIDDLAKYAADMNGGGNSGESSIEASLAVMSLLAGYDPQAVLLHRLLADCKKLHNGQGKPGDIVPFLTKLVAGAIPDMVRQGQTKTHSTEDVIFLITDEPGLDDREAIIKMAELKALQMKHGLFGIITPQAVHDSYWKHHIAALGAQWFCLDGLVGQQADLKHLSLVQARLAEAITEQVAAHVVTDLKPLLQIAGPKTGSGVISL